MMTKIKPLVSIVVPAYNCADSIARCVDSLLAQTYENIEIIIVDDGSLDDTGKIIDEISKKDDRIKTIHKKNGGCHTARAHGFVMSKGEWITFVDSDDTLVLDAIDRLVEATSDDTDIVVGFSYENKEPLHSFSIQEWRSKIIRSDVTMCAPWGKLFRCAIVSPEVFELYTSNRISEDMPMNIKISFNTEKKVVLIPGKIYNYSIVEGSMSRSAKWTIEKIADLYTDIVLSIPVHQKSDYMLPLIENRLSFIKNKVLSSKINNMERIGNSDFMGVLKNDIKVSSCKMPFSSWLLAFHPDSIITFIFVRLARKFLIAKQFVIRKYLCDS